MCVSSKICWREPSLLTIQELFRPTSWISPSLKVTRKPKPWPQMGLTDRWTRWRRNTSSGYCARQAVTKSVRQKFLVSNGGRSITRQSASELISGPFKYKIARTLGDYHED